MRKQIATIVAISCLLLFSNNATAQLEDFEGNANFAEGQIDINVGLGLLPTFLGSGLRVRIPPVGVSAEYAFTDEISGGAFFGISSSRNKSLSDIKYRYMLVGARVAYHFNLAEEVDTYFGVMLGMNRSSARFDDNLFPGFDPGNIGFAYAFYGGVRYPFADNIGAFGEIGYGISYITVGLTLKLAKE